MAGEKLVTVAKMAGCSVQAVAAFKKRIFKPALKLAAQIQPYQQVNSLEISEPVKVAQHAALTRDILGSSPFQERLQRLWHRTEKALDKAETAVREIKDTHGNVVALADDLSAVAPLLNQAHKNVLILGRATGELETSAAVGIAIQIVLPAPPNSAPKKDDCDVIDIDVTR